MIEFQELISLDWDTLMCAKDLVLQGNENRHSTTALADMYQQFAENRMSEHEIVVDHIERMLHSCKEHDDYLKMMHLWSSESHRIAKYADEVKELMHF